MKAIALFMSFITINTFACPTANLTNLSCNDSGFGEYILKSVMVSPSQALIDDGSEVIEMAIPYSSESLTVTCTGNTITYTEKAGGYSVNTTIVFAGNTIQTVGERFVWRCDAGPEGCDKDIYYVEGIESFTDTCIAN